ncbi:transcription factor bHLH157-like [Rutidosis leptorrhynchoides]|uniref:transcription factor bHLH157-like n=1 Tax=Rutidosis leptorrhynchoides TaxID=125765 RepID=UPI003A996427
MGTSLNDSAVKNVLKNLCISYGWSYGVFWNFDQPNSILLTMQDAYFKEEIQGLLDDLVLQSPILGGGLIGQAALTKKHQWLSSEDNYIGQCSSGSIWDMFQDESKFCRQFSLGIKTIAAIPVEPQGVVQFGSIEKISEKAEFVNQTKQMFNGLFASLISSKDSYFGGATQFTLDQNSLTFLNQPLSFGSESQPMFLDNNQYNSHLEPNRIPWSTTSSLTSVNEPQPNMFDLPMDFGILDEFFQTGDFNTSQWVPQSPVQSNVTLNDQLLSQSTGFHTISSDEKVKPLTFSGTDVNLLGSNGDLGDIVTPLVNENHSRFDSYNSGASKSNLTQNINNDITTLPPKKGLFSNLGIKELFEGKSGTSTSCIEDQVSTEVKRRKLENSIFKSEPGLWTSDSYSIDGSSTISQAKKKAEPAKPAKKKAKPGTRPRPKDRQMILDRMAELRELIPNGEKMSIDCLLDRTIKHMLFLQSVTKHADIIKQIDEPKRNGVIPNKYSNDPNNNGVTWACELGNQSMICPLIVEDLSTPGQMLIEMICEEHGFFLEIVDIIRSFGLSILKGVMEAREEKIWARFIVEAEAKRHVTRHEIFAALVQLLQTIGSNGTHLDNKMMQTGNSLHNNFQHSSTQLPVSFADAGYCVNL